jgi:ABC-type transport system substrate-binding protein
MKRLRWLVSIIFVISLLAACVPPVLTTQSGEVPGKSTSEPARATLRIGVSDMTDVLDAQQAFTGFSVDSGQIAQPLFRIDPKTGGLIPDLATSWEFSEDGTSGRTAQ